MNRYVYIGTISFRIGSTIGDDGTTHSMDDAYFNEYFTRVFTDKDGYYVER